MESSGDKALKLVEQGAVRAATPKDAATGRDLVMTMLADDAALEDVVSGTAGFIHGLAHAGYSFDETFGRN